MFSFTWGFAPKNKSFLIRSLLFFSSSLCRSPFHSFCRSKNTVWRKRIPQQVREIRSSEFRLLRCQCAGWLFSLGIPYNQSTLLRMSLVHLRKYSTGFFFLSGASLRVREKDEKTKKTESRIVIDVIHVCSPIHVLFANQACRYVFSLTSTSRAFHASICEKLSRAAVFFPSCFSPFDVTRSFTERD